jgi:hypothetical protein
MSVFSLGLSYAGDSSDLVFQFATYGVSAARILLSSLPACNRIQDFSLLALSFVQKALKTDLSRTKLGKECAFELSHPFMWLSCRRAWFE